jgi:hypothetical protein
MKKVMWVFLAVCVAVMGSAGGVMAAGDHEAAFDNAFHGMSVAMESYAEAVGTGNWSGAQAAAKAVGKAHAVLEGLEAPHGADLWSYEIHAVEEHLGELTEVSRNKEGEHAVIVFAEVNFHLQILRSMAPHFLEAHGEETLEELAAAVNSKNSALVHELGEEVHSMANNMIYAGYLAKGAFANTRWQKSLQELAHAGHEIGEAAEKGDWGAAGAIVAEANKSLKKYTNSLK